MIEPSRSVWKAFRRGDVRYTDIMNRFSDRLLARNPGLTQVELKKSLTKTTAIRTAMDTAISSNGRWGRILLALTEGKIYPCSRFTQTTVNAFHSSGGKPIQSLIPLIPTRARFSSITSNKAMIWRPGSLPESNSSKLLTLAEGWSGRLTSVPSHWHPVRGSSCA